MIPQLIEHIFYGRKLQVFLEKKWDQNGTRLQGDNAGGLLGFLLTAVMGGRYFPNESLWEDRIVELARETISSLNREGLPPGMGLMIGLAGYPFTFRLTKLPALHRAADQLDEALFNRLEKFLGLPYSLPLLDSTFDTIYGLSGTGRYLLERCIAGDSRAEALLIQILERFIQAAHAHEKHLTQGFFTTSSVAASQQISRDPKTAQGYLSLGLSHGIPGPLTLLALAHNHLRLEGQRDAIELLGSFLQERIYRGPYGDDIPPVVVPDEPVEISKAKRAAWCYGIPGVASSLFIAAKALGDSGLLGTAERLAKALGKRTLDQLLLEGPALCHGYAGVLHIWGLLKEVVPIELGVRRQQELLSAIETAYQPELDFGFVNPDRPDERGDPTFLEGSCGILLALMSAQDPKTQPMWSQALMLG